MPNKSFKTHRANTSIIIKRNENFTVTVLKHSLLENNTITRQK